MRIVSHLFRTFVVCGLAFYALTACENTLEGAGDDIQRMGDRIEDATD